MNDAKYTSKPVNLDKDVLEILQKVNPIYRDTILNMGVKLFAMTDVFKLYFSEKDQLDQNNLIGGLDNINNVSNTNTQNMIGSAVGSTVGVNQNTQNVQPVQNTQQNTQPPIKAVSSWDDF